MKKVYLLLCTALICCSVFAQAPQSISYQAVIRNSSNLLLSNTKVGIKISILKGSPDDLYNRIAYSEIQNVTTNQNGLISLQIGSGITTNVFSSIDWSKGPFFIKTETDPTGGSNYTITGTSQLVSVPYALYAKTAGSCPVPVTVVGKGLNIDSSVTLNTVSGHTTNYGDFTVENNSNTILTGQLSVKGTTHLINTLLTDGATTLNNTLDVTGATHLKNTLLTDGAATLGNTLDVTGATHLKSTLATDAATTLGSTLVVTGISTFNESARFNKGILVGGKINLSGNDPSFLAKIENTNTETGDGLVIKLGRTDPAWNGKNNIKLEGPGRAFVKQTETIKGWMLDNKKFEASQLSSFFPSGYSEGMVCQVLNILTPQLNKLLDLPFELPALKIPGFRLLTGFTIIPGTGVSNPVRMPTLEIPEVVLTKKLKVIPKIPKADCDFSGFATIVPKKADFTINPNSLTNENQYIIFKDKDDRELGSIRAQSVPEWKERYLDENYFVKLMAGMVGLDPVSGFAGAVAGFSDLADAYNHIGVEYKSGHGDYAEWLERSDAAEIISAGDIVAVKGGKVSKDLRGAEQILVVSHNPIVLGNAPTANNEKYGNKIAFMGQVPVKVDGPVTSGDYIIAKGEIVGYGVAVHADKMTDKDYKLSIGRSWESNLNDGPKMVNTLIGVDNGNYFSILKKSKDQATALEAKTIRLEKRMKLLESNMNTILLAASSKIGPKKTSSKLVRNTLK